jgi:hypothetical protein
VIQSRKSEIGGACSTYGGKARCVQDFGRETREGDYWRGLVVDGRIIIKWIFNKWDGSMYWIELAEDRDRWRALVNAVMNLRVQ